MRVVRDAGRPAHKRNVFQVSGEQCRDAGGHDYGYGVGFTPWLLEGESVTCKVCGMERKRQNGRLVFIDHASTQYGGEKK
jgi:hypothetical protein